MRNSVEIHCVVLEMKFTDGLTERHGRPMSFAQRRFCLGLMEIWILLY